MGKLKVLIVDDMPSARGIIKASLKESFTDFSLVRLPAEGKLKRNCKKRVATWCCATG